MSNFPTLAEIRSADNGADVLDAVRATLTKYVVFPDDESADAVTLYAAATWASPHLAYATRLIVRSPERRCGKSRLIADVMPHLVRRPLKSVSISPAALVHSISETSPPTIIMDETDTVFSKASKADEKNELLRGILNSGFSRGMPYLRWDAQARAIDECPTFAPAILGGINNGRMPDTIEDRSVIVTLQRKGPGESVARYRERLHGPEIREVGERLSDWVTPISEKLADATPELPDRLNDRAQDAWESLLAIADEAGNDWPSRARRAALKLAGEAEEDDADSRRLLADLRDVFAAAGTEVMSTESIRAGLNGIAEAPWGTWFGHPLTARDLGGLLKPYGVKSGTVRIGDSTPKGYKRADLVKVWDRYLPKLAQPGGGGATSATSTTSQVSPKMAPATHPPHSRHNADVAERGGNVAVAKVNRTGVSGGSTL